VATGPAPALVGQCQYHLARNHAVTPAIVTPEVQVEDFQTIDGGSNWDSTYATIPALA